MTFQVVIVKVSKFTIHENFLSNDYIKTFYTISVRY